MNRFVCIILLSFMFFPKSALFAQSAEGEVFRIARLKYSGGSDWYNDPSCEVNLLKYAAEHTSIKTLPAYVFVDAASTDIFNFPFLFATGHGNMRLTDEEVINLRNYLLKGGFLYVDDDYGLDKYFRREIARVFPNKKLVELPYNYGLYQKPFKFSYGPPKTHKHNGKPPQGFGIFINGKLAVYYTYESNPSDGWADPDVHNDPPAKREEALKFGTNLVLWSLIQ